MEQVVLKQLEIVRQLTVNAVKDLTEETVVKIPEGFNNHIKWNLGHIYLVQERFAFFFSGEPMNLPENFDRLFGRGTKPADWNEEVPTLSELLVLLEEQPKRIQESLKGRLNESVERPYTTSSGVTLSTIGEFINFSLYHEGLHLHAISTLKRFINR
ncbi:DinB family protein [Bacillus sp. 31A1R]|uniref:DinB family protein n=1 Tax=Robertmurraya mangrovi TaxID=3098077 RepID=A0ABU5J0S9_9BACI|nr:DinB family protein [Bacillus sp. 31A1R]MDZ5473028.1 DinB family protein [Bacillus sp. 31A1R]